MLLKILRKNAFEECRKHALHVWSHMFVCMYVWKMNKRDVFKEILQAKHYISLYVYFYSVICYSVIMHYFFNFLISMEIRRKVCNRFYETRKRKIS